MYSRLMDVSTDAPVILGNFLINIVEQKPLSGDLSAQINLLLKKTIEQYPESKEQLCLEVMELYLAIFKNTCINKGDINAVKTYLMEVHPQVQADLGFLPINIFFELYTIYRDIRDFSLNKFSEIKTMCSIADGISIEYSFIKYKVYRELLSFLISSGEFIKDIELTKYLTKQASTQTYTQEQIDEFAQHSALFLF